MKISVLIPVYNTDPLQLMDCLASCFQQTLPPAEVLVVDDGSSDIRTVNFLTSIKSGFDHRLRILSLSHHQGISQALNYGLMQSNNDWVARMDSDDVMMPHRLERQAKELETTVVDVLGSQMMYFGNEAGTFTSFTKNIDNDFALNHESGWFMNHPTVLYNRNSVLSAGGYDPNFNGTEDIELWYRMLALGFKLANMNDVLLLYRRHSAQVTAQKRHLELARFKSYFNRQTNCDRLEAS